jgi:hypothetical protein
MVRDDLVELSDYTWQRLIDRLGGLTDEEYFWEPVTGSWTIRAGPDGTWTWDFVWSEPDPPPITTIAWRLTHITVNDDRFRPWLGLAPHRGRPHRTIPSTAAAAVEAAETTKAQRHDDLMEVTDAELSEKIGPIGGPYADGTRVSWVLHAIDEVIHHGAEIALLRDLYARADEQRR